MKPSILYKYLSQDRLTFFGDNLLRISQRSCLNDPFEMSPAKPNYDEWMNFMENSKKFHIAKYKASNLDKISMIKHIVHWDKYIESEKSNFGNVNAETFYNHSWNQCIKKIDEIGGVISLSERWNSSLMWAHYSNSHEGFCIGFNTDKLEKHIEILHKIIYSNKRYKIHLGETSEVNWNAFFTKSLDWSYEKEYRMLLHFNTADKTVDIKPYPIYLKKIPTEIICEIIVGARASIKTREAIKTFALNNSIDLFEAIEADYTFDMDRKSM